MTSHDHARSGHAAAGGRNAFFAAFLSALLKRVTCGRIAVRLPGGELVAHAGLVPGPEALIVLHRWRALRRLLLKGDLGFAESYLDGDWTTPDLTAVIELAARNGPTLDPAITGSRAARALGRLRHLLRANTRWGARRNIAFHYDLGNAFYAEWLDASMTYSSALYGPRARTLEEAQQAKLARVRALLALQGGERVLEIGCGWGALACSLGRAGAQVTGLTLSPSQLARAQARVRDEGLAAAVDLRLEDYRDAQGAYDRVVSIEMIEAVGEQYWRAYFEVLRRRVSEEGRVVLQVITIAEERYAAYARAADFIQRYVFPGGMLPTKRILRECAEAAGLVVASSETFAESYALTLAEWRRRFLAAWPRIAEQGFDLRFRRLWEYYLSYCEAGFRAGAIDVGLYVLRPAGSK
ncbi:MAG TPA: cyclopropane-fatty-acyl-phospholipid synthase family protein [Beijerinckiaceae bacterium]